MHVKNRLECIRKTLFVLGAAISFFCMASSGYCGINVSPTTVELVVATGADSKGQFSIVNPTDEQVHVKVEVEDWLKHKMGKSGIALAKWLTLTPMEFDLGPKTAQDVEYTINVPKGQAGELVAMVFFATSSLQGNMNIVSRIGSSIYAAIGDSVILACNIRKTQVMKNIIKQENGSTIDKGAIFNINVENKGNVHIRPTGRIVVTGQDKATYTVPIERGFPVYPGANLDYAVLWDKTDIAPGRYEGTIELDYGNIYNVDKKLVKKIRFEVKKNGTISS